MRYLTGVFLAASSSAALAHPGHVLPAETHDHGFLALIAVAAIATAVAAFAAWRNRSR